MCQLCTCFKYDVLKLYSPFLMQTPSPSANLTRNMQKKFARGNQPRLTVIFSTLAFQDFRSALSAQ